MRNSFKELEELEMQNVSMESSAIRNGIASDIGILRFMTSIVEMYFPRIVDLFVGFSGGEPGDSDVSRQKSKYPDLN